MRWMSFLGVGWLSRRSWWWRQIGKRVAIQAPCPIEPFWPWIHWRRSSLQSVIHMANRYVMSVQYSGVQTNIWGPLWRTSQTFWKWPACMVPQKILTSAQVCPAWTYFFKTFLVLCWGPFSKCWDIGCPGVSVNPRPHGGHPSANKVYDML